MFGINQHCGNENIIYTDPDIMTFQVDKLECYSSAAKGLL